MDKTVKTETPEKALSRLMNLCARREYCSSDALALMARWGVEQSCRGDILAKLKQARFIDDSRYTTAFVRDKTQLSTWGAYKISSALNAKHIDRQTIAQAIEEYFPQDASERLMSMLKRKIKTTKYKDAYDLRTKLIRYGASAGYSLDVVIDCVGKMVKTDEKD